MITLQQHPHAAFDRFPQLVHDLAAEFGTDEIGAVADRFIDAERADFYWDGRIAEMPLEACDDCFEEGEEPLQQVAILGYFRGRYYVATSLVDDERRVRWMFGIRHFDDFASAKETFRAAG